MPAVPGPGVYCVHGFDKRDSALSLLFDLRFTAIFQLCEAVLHRGDVEDKMKNYFSNGQLWLSASSGDPALYGSGCRSDQQYVSHLALASSSASKFFAFRISDKILTVSSLAVAVPRARACV